MYRVQLAIETTLDVVAMLVKDKGHTVSDDYHNLEQLAEIRVISKKESEEIKKLNGLRNAIVHKYNQFEEEVILKQKEKIKKIILDFLKIVEDELKNIS